MPSITEAAKTNNAFRFALIGALMLSIGIIIVAVTSILTFKLTMRAIVSLSAVALLVILILAYDVYQTYCVVYGHCDALAMEQGISLILVGTVFLVMSLVFVVKRNNIQFLFHK